MIERIVIGAPFGNYFNWPGCTSTLGTYTLAKRAGPIKRWWRVLSTVRYNWRTQSWINKFGLPNSGIASMPSEGVDKKIVSIHGFSSAEWLTLVKIAQDKGAKTIELNLSCPNVPHVEDMLREVRPAIYMAMKAGLVVVAKLAPVRWKEVGYSLYSDGVRYFHLCNTIPTPGGGLSGAVLKQYSLWAIRDFRAAWGNKIYIIGGGGVVIPNDALEYINTGADSVAMASALFNPLMRHRRVNAILTEFANRNLPTRFDNGE